MREACRRFTSDTSLRDVVQRLGRLLILERTRAIVTGIECRLDNHVPVVAVARQRRKPTHSDAVSEGLIDEGAPAETRSAPDDARGNSEQESEPETFPQRPNENKPTGTLNVFTPFSEDPKCETCLRCAGMVWNFREIITADHAFLTLHTVSVLKVHTGASQAVSPSLSYSLSLPSLLLDAEWKGPERGHVRGNTALL